MYEGAMFRRRCVALCSPLQGSARSNRKGPAIAYLNCADIHLRVRQKEVAWLVHIS